MSYDLKEDGFTVLHGVFSPSVLEDFRSLTDRIIEYGKQELIDPFGDYYLRHRTDQGALYDLYQRHPEFRLLAQEDRILDAIEPFLGPDIFLYENSLVYKPKKSNNAVPWHQDFMNRPDEPVKLIAWIAFDDVTVENGALNIVPGSHKLGFLPWYKVRGETHHTRLKLDGVDLSTARPAELSAGDVLVFHQLVVHGSDKVSSDLPRRAYRVSYQGFDQVSTPRGTPIVLRGGSPESLARRFDAPASSVPPPGLARRGLHFLGEKLRRI